MSPRQTKLQLVEEEHGFIFGLPDEYDDNGAALLKQVKCENPGCERSRHDAPTIPIHEDTVQPVLCGGCGTVLHCDHDAGDEVESVEGTLLAPVTVVSTKCTKCGTSLREKRVEHEPVRMEELPAAVLAQLGVAFTPKGP